MVQDATLKGGATLALGLACARARVLVDGDGMGGAAQLYGGTEIEKLDCWTGGTGFWEKLVETPRSEDRDYIADGDRKSADREIGGPRAIRGCC